MADRGYDVDWLETLKARNEIVSTISKYIKLDKKGRNWWGRCPFHHEKTPSFSVNELEQYYHCFGCGESGDVITFVEKFESVDFMDAVKILADNAGMEIPSFHGDKEIEERKKRRDITLRLLYDAKEHYKENLLKPTAKIAQDYIKMRGLTNRELKDFELGYSQNWNEMIDYLLSKGYSIEDMKQAGIAEEKNGRAYDVFGERLIFPIINIHGDCIGFTARILVKSDFAKYKNSPNTCVFDKSNVVYAINLVKKLKQEQGVDSIIIVEGQMDVVAMHKAGFRNAVACMGTALTPFHAKQLKRLVDNVFVCFDGDAAGQKATKRSLDILQEAGLNTKVVSLPENLDPDEIIKKYGVDRLKKEIENALPITDYRLRVCEEKYNLNIASEKQNYIKEAINIIGTIEFESEKEPYLEIIKKKTNVPIDVLRRDSKLAGVPREEKNEEKVLTFREDGNIKAVKFVLAALLHKKPYAKLSAVIEEGLTSPDLKKLYSVLKKSIQENKEFHITTLFDMFDVDSSQTLKDLINFDFSKDKVDEEKYYAECLWQIKEQTLKLKQQELANLYKEEKDLTKRREIAEKLNDVLKELKKKKVEE